MKRCRHQVLALVFMFILLPMFPFANANGQPAPGDLIHEWTDGFNRPAGVAVDKDGNVYVADTNNNKIKVFDSEGIQIYEWGGGGPGDGQFNAPAGIAIDADRTVYVADTRNNRVQVFKYDQTLDAWAFHTKWGAVGPGDGQFKFPSGIAVGTDRTVYVADTVNNRVQVFKYDQTSDAWAFHTKWGKIGTGEGQFYNPYGIAVDAVDYVYVADTLNSRLQVFSNSGGFIGKWNIPQPDHIGALPRGIAIDPAGYLYVTDSVDPYDRVLVIAGTGSSPTAWTLKAEWNEIYLSNAWGIALDVSEPCTSKVYVADERSSRILVLQGFGGAGGGTPAITCPADINVLTDQCSAVVTYEVTATDGCSEVPGVVDPPSGSAFPIGTTLVTATAGDIGTCTFNVTVEEEVPPTINNISASPSVLWPANHKMVPVAVAVSASDNCDAAPVCRITSVSSNEPVDGLGDGDTAPDWEITGNLTVNLRAERSGTESGRVYTIAAQCTDVSGNSSTTTVAVTVPHDQKKK